MGELFSIRSLVYWWGMLTATAFIKDWLKALSTVLTDGKTFTPDKVPFNLVPSLNATIDNAADYIRKAIDFKPQQIIATIGPLAIPGWALALVLGLVFIGLGVRLYLHALRSPAWYDDFLTLFVLYIILRLEGHIVGQTGLPLQDWFKALVNNQAVPFVIIIILLLSLSFAGEGLRSKRAFWRALIAAAVVALFIYPSQTASVLGRIVDGLTFLGESLTNTKDNMTFIVVWGVVGMILAIHRLMTPEAEVGGRAAARD